MKVKNYRLEIRDQGGARLYLTRRSKGGVQLMSGDLTPLALSNIAGAESALLSFALSDASDEREAIAAVRKFARYVKEVKAI